MLSPPALSQAHGNDDAGLIGLCPTFSKFNTHNLAAGQNPPASTPKEVPLCPCVFSVLLSRHCRDKWRQLLKRG